MGDRAAGGDGRGRAAARLAWLDHPDGRRPVTGWRHRHRAGVSRQFPGQPGRGPVGPGHRRPAATGPATASPAASAGAARPGPKLSSEPYAGFSFQVWPGTLSTAARQAMTGLKITVRKQGNGLLVTAGVIGQPASPPHLYPGGARVYVVEASLGDDSGNADYNLGDDGLVVTDSQQRILP